jgi:hypothetical protein
VSATVRGAVFTIELYYAGAWHDITCQTTSADWRWGAPEALGPLTECEGGTLRVSLHDPDREYDPDNPDSPLLGVLKVGGGFRVWCDGAPAWTGVLQTWGWDRASGIADLNGLDPIGQLSVRALPTGQTLAPVLATSAAQAQFMLDLVEWPVGKRFFPDGTSGVERGNHFVEGPVLDGLHRIRFAELGRLFPLRDGGIGWYDRDGPASPPAVSLTVDCTDLTGMWKVMGLGRVRNHVVISGGYGVFGPKLPPDEYRSVTTNSEFLQLGAVAGDPLPWDLWANTILDALEHPPVLTLLGTLVPYGAEVKPIVTAEFGARWTVQGLSGDKVVQVLGQRVTLAPGVLEIDAVTEDVAPPVPVKHALMGAGSGYLRSFNDISYANARAGASLTATVPGGPAPIVQIGQTFLTGPSWEVFEGFVYFDTSSIPAGATILSAKFAAMVLPRDSIPVGSMANITVELRSGYPWRPTLTTADWRPGAGIAGPYPLRATWNTANGINYQEFADAGSGLAGAVVKGGETQLLVVSDRTTTGTAPTSTTVFEDWRLQFPRLRVTYTLP